VNISNDVLTKYQPSLGNTDILAVLQKVNEVVTFDEDELYSLHKTSWMINIMESLIVDLTPWFKVMFSEHYYRKGEDLHFASV
jgi:hypothetical protein